MVSILSVPEQKASDTSKVELRPSPTREKLAKLPLLDSQDSLNRILEALHHFNRVPVVPGIRLRLLELYRTPIGFIGENVEKTLAESYIPLSDKYGLLADTCKQVIIEMAYGYKSVVIDLAKGGRSKRPQEDLCTAIHRSIKYLTLSLHQSAVHYTGYAPGTWVEIHSLYTYALKLGIEEKKVKDVLNPVKVKNTVSHAYRQALLFGLSDNYRHPIPINAKILRWVERWASSVEIVRFKTPEADRFNFVVDPAQDLPATPYSENLNLKKTKRLLLLSTKEITKITHYHWRNMRTGNKPKSISLGEDYFDAVAYEMLRRLVIQWGVAPKRRYPRNEISERYELALGVDASNYFLNGASSFKHTPSTTQELQAATAGTFGLHRMKKRDEDFEVQEWQARDESINGLCLCTSLENVAQVRVRVGEVVAFRPARTEGKWSTGLVRWVRITDPELRIGLEKVGVGAKPIAVKPATDSGDVEEYFKNSILFPKHDAIRQTQSMITPPGAYKLHRNLIVDDGKKLTTVKAKKLLEHGRQYEWFDYELVESQ